MMAVVDAKLLPDLLVFFEVARVGSISEAARRLHMVQTNVTVRIQKLEAALGIRLLDRGARGSRLTAGGEALVPLAARLVTLLEDVDLAFQKSDHHKSELLRLGASRRWWPHACPHCWKGAASSTAGFSLRLLQEAR